MQHLSKMCRSIPLKLVETVKLDVIVKSLQLRISLHTLGRLIIKFGLKTVRAF